MKVGKSAWAMSLIIATIIVGGMVGCGGVEELAGTRQVIGFDYDDSYMPEIIYGLKPVELPFDDVSPKSVFVILDGAIEEDVEIVNSAGVLLAVRRMGSLNSNALLQPEESLPAGQYEIVIGRSKLAFSVKPYQAYSRWQRALYSYVAFHHHYSEVWPFDGERDVPLDISVQAWGKHRMEVRTADGEVFAQESPWFNPERNVTAVTHQGKGNFASFSRYDVFVDGVKVSFFETGDRTL